MPSQSLTTKPPTRLYHRLYPPALTHPWKTAVVARGFISRVGIAYHIARQFSLSGNIARLPWCIGNIVPCHGTARGSTPRGRAFFFFCFNPVSFELLDVSRPVAPSSVSSPLNSSRGSPLFLELTRSRMPALPPNQHLALTRSHSPPALTTPRTY